MTLDFAGNHEFSGVNSRLISPLSLIILLKCPLQPTRRI